MYAFYNTICVRSGRGGDPHLFANIHTRLHLKAPEEIVNVTWLPEIGLGDKGEKYTCHSMSFLTISMWNHVNILFI